MRKALGTIGVMSGLEYIAKPWVMSFSALLQRSQEEFCKDGDTIHTQWAAASLHYAARNDIAANMQGEWLLMLDCDHVFHETALVRLLECMYHKGKADPLPVVSGLYFYHQVANLRPLPRPYPVAGDWADESEPDGSRTQLDIVAMVEQGIHKRGGLYPIGWCGGGLLLVNRMVFERIAVELDEEPFTPIIADSGILGEDISFCYRCRRLGIPIHLAPHVEAPHLEVRTVSLRDFVPPEMLASEPTGAKRAEA